VREFNEEEKDDEKRPANRPINLAVARNLFYKGPEYFFRNVQALENSEMKLCYRDLYIMNTNNFDDK
jgi:hypothetical protein